MTSLCLIAALALAVAAQKPDFSGTWKQDNAKSQFAGQPAPIGLTDIVRHKEPDLHLTQTVVGPQGDSITSEHDYSTTGQERTGSSRNYTEKNSVKWEGASLVFTNTRDYNGRQIVIRERWTLSEDGRTIRKERFTPGPKGELKQVFVLDKQ